MYNRQTRDARIKSTDVSKGRADVRNSQYTTRWIHLGMAELKQHQITYGVTGILEPLKIFLNSMPYNNGEHNSPHGRSPPFGYALYMHILIALDASHKEISKTSR
jgi:hypothetical protein